ncbi:MAG: hypothetical protein PWQ67_428 [Clostridia bacterium]|jgi:molybdopterin converting factor small subunit|nr:hypothetical protein [Clostridia bacterium]MDN5321974.1 hypothetical protein [Clostridia bacterium]
MEVYLKLGPPFNKLLNQERVRVNLSQNQATFEEVLHKLYQDYPGLLEKMQEEGLLIKGKPRAILVVNGKLASFTDIIEDQSNIKLLTPLCGG